MAKKKVSLPAPAEKKPSAPARDTSPEKIERLKALNSLLVRETVERRGQMKLLRSQMADLAEDHAFLAGVEREVGRLVLSACVDELRREAAAREAEANLRRSEKKMMEAEVRLLAADKAAAVEKMSSLMGKLDSMAEALQKAEGRLESVAREKSEVKKALDRAVSEKDLIQMDLDRNEKEMRELRVRIRELQKENSQIRADLEAVETERDDLLKQGKKREEAYRSLMREKASLEGRLEEYRTTVEGLNREMEEKVRKKQEELEVMKVKKEATGAQLSALEAQQQRLIENKNQLDAEMRSSKFTIDSLKKVEEGLRSRIAEMEEKDANSTEELERFRAVFAALEKEKEGLLLDMEARSKDFATAMDDLKNQLRGIRGEKDKIAEERALQEAEIDNLRKEVARLQSSLSELQDQCKEHVEKNTQLQANRDSARRLLDLQEEAARRLRSEVGELKKSKDASEQELQKIKAALDGLVTENEERKVENDSLVEEKALLEKKLMTAQQRLEDTERKMKTAEVKSERVLRLLKRTTEAMNEPAEGKVDGIARDIGNGDEVDEEIGPFAEQLEAIKMAFRKKARMVEDMKRELELLQRAVAEAQKKKGGLWMWLYPATTTVLAAISLAYASRAR